MILKQSTAVDVLIGPFVDSTDGYTAESGVSPSVKLSKNGQALGVKNDATTPAHDADGYYNCELDATDTNTVGTLVLTIAGDATALGVRHEFQVVEESVYDALYTSGAPGPLEANDTGSGLTDLGGMSVAMQAEVNAEADTALSDYDPPTNTELVAAFTEIKGATWASGTDTLEAIRDRGDVAWLTGAGGSAPTVGEIADAVWDEATSGHTSADTFGEQCKTDIDAILADTNELQTDDVPTLIGALNDVSSADVNAACDTALTDYDAPTKAELDAGLAALNDLAAADVNAEVVDVLKTDTIADRSAGQPPAAPTFEQALAYLYGSMRNSIDVDSGFKEFHNDAGALIWKKALSDDGTNYVEAKGVAP